MWKTANYKLVGIEPLAEKIVMMDHRKLFISPIIRDHHFRPDLILISISQNLPDQIVSCIGSQTLIQIKLS